MAETNWLNPSYMRCTKKKLHIFFFSLRLSHDGRTLTGSQGATIRNECTAGEDGHRLLHLPCHIRQGPSQADRSAWLFVFTQTSQETTKRRALAQAPIRIHLQELVTQKRRIKGSLSEERLDLLFAKSGTCRGQQLVASTIDFEARLTTELKLHASIHVDCSSINV